jgi:hypothetical protein
MVSVAIVFGVLVTWGNGEPAMGVPLGNFACEIYHKRVFRATAGNTFIASLIEAGVSVLLGRRLSATARSVALSRQQLRAERLRATQEYLLGAACGAAVSYGRCQ